MHYRFFREVSGASKNVVSLVVRVFATTAIIGCFAVVLMHYMGVPLPNISDLWHGLGFSKLARAFS
jgi:ABC-type dipeptide/oligopeptide/nickel transport system permease component